MDIIYFISLFAVPIILSIILNFDIKNKKAPIKEEYKYIKKAICNIIKIIMTFFFLQSVLTGNTTENGIINMWINILYFSIMITMIIVINYFSTRYSEFRSAIKTYLDSLMKFFKEAFILNLIFVMLIIFVRSNKDLTLGLVSSYIFFVLTEIYNDYKKNKKHNGDYKPSNILIQIILNVMIMYVFTDIEGIINKIALGKDIFIKISALKHLLILVLIISINSFMPQIMKNLDKFGIYKKNKGADNQWKRNIIN